MNTSAATTPTKTAAIISIVSMKRSANGRGGRPPAAGVGPASDFASGMASLDTTTAANAPAAVNEKVLRGSAAQRRGLRQYEALYWASVSLSSFMIASGLPPAP